MVPFQPIYLHRYLSREKVSLPQTLKHFFFVSFEDALWVILKHFNVVDQSLVLVPNFFCEDVINNMANHGLRAICYPVSRDFQTDPVLFKKYLCKYRPKVVIIFHAVGITNTLWENFAIWKPALETSTILIEDSVHRIVDPQKIKLVSKYHIVINSLRKVTPLPGSDLYLDKDINLKIPGTSLHQLRYQHSVLFWWLLFQLCLHIVPLLPTQKWHFFWNRLAEKCMLIGYEVIGDSLTGVVGWSWIKKIANHLSPKKIEQEKRTQYKIYKKILKKIANHSQVFFPKVSNSDFGKIRGFPLGLNVKESTKLLRKIRTQGLLIRFELNDCPWSVHQKICYLPMGPHLSNSDINWAAKTVVKCIQNINNE